MLRFDVVIADITKYQADAIVNAANVKLLGGGGVDGAIHRAAGPRLLQTCQRFGGCATGEARITPAFNIATADYVIHTPGPVFSESDASRSDEMLARCYFNSIKLANEHYCRTLAFPSISTGVYRFPLERAANVVAAVFEKTRGAVALERITMCCFDVATHDAYVDAFRRSGLL